MYKFFGEPLKIITSKTSGKPVFRFDTKGEFITDDPEIIKRAMGFFDYVPMKAETVGEKVAKTYIVPPVTITTKDVETITINKPVLKDEIKKELAKVYKCKKCDFETEKQGDLMRHYKEHKKE
jgi:hypothetical protein